MACKRVMLAGAMALVLTACDAPTVPRELPGYEPRGDYGFGLQLMHWPLGRTIRIYVDPAAEGGVLTEHVRAGAEAWKDVVYYREFDIALVSSPANADVIVHTQPADFLVDFADCLPPSGGAGGVTYGCPDVEGERLMTLPLLDGGGGSVKLDVMIDLADAATPAALRALVTHELGHVFGIGTHSGSSSDVMFAGPTVTVPSERDASTLRYLLHQPANLRP